MGEFNYWRLCDDLSILQASFLTVGEVSSNYEYIENWEMDKKATGIGGRQNSYT